ncbi:MAG: thioredoxin domain-containing protein, partial [Candidatus Thermoplasmatota archaeon]|nr:thioredoxin domain-containing protein [Candidatus Thermoplasmatota archaeon]
MTEYTNRLINEKSPYLQQHAHNPVDWYPWGEEAFKEAKSRNRPIFLSIGYSTCHWCHVMERESFEHPQVADVLNRTFVCIKVDREERPDLDSTFMAVSQMMTGTGGWPLNIILTPDGVPVFALTYIPRESRGGQVGIIDLANQINELWTEGHEDVERRAQEVLSNLKNMNAHSPSGTLGND